MKILLCAVLVVCVCLGYTAKLKLPPYIKPCPRNDYKCGLQSARLAVSDLANGDKKYGIPSFKPLILKGVTVNTTQLAINLVEVKIHGVEDSIIKELKMNADKQTVNLEIIIPKLKLDGQYAMSGRILIIPLDGHGDFWIKCDQVHVTAQLFYHLKSRHGEEHMEFDLEKKKIDINMDHASFWFYNLLNGNEALGNSTNGVLNDEWPKVLEEISPAISETIISVASTVFNNIGHKVPYKNFFTDS